jgi:hypothetical protein
MCFRVVAWDQISEELNADHEVADDVAGEERSASWG